MREITEKEREEFDAVVGHPLQAYEWGEFRENTGVKVIRRGLFEGAKLISAFQLTIHKIPRTSYSIGYLPKGEMPTEEMIEELQRIGKEEKCIFIQLEPNARVIPANVGIQKREAKDVDLRVPNSPKAMAGQDKPKDDKLKKLGLIPAVHPLFTKYTFVLDLTKSEDELLAGMHPKGRYNIKVAIKHGVKVAEDNSDKVFEEYLRLTKETTTRQKFYAHTPTYHRLMWETLKAGNSKFEIRNSKQTQNSKNKNAKSLERSDLGNLNIVSDFGFSASKLRAHLFTADYQNEALTTLMFFTFHDTLYYPYGASSNKHRNVMHSNLAMWEGIRFGKKLGLKKFDMWGAMGPDPDPKDPWYGFHSFKEKFGPGHVEFIGSFDLVINPTLYQLYKIADKIRWIVLKLKR